MLITSLTIKDLRGIREGTLSDLAPLTVLTGPNGCGKSTVLDAVLLGAGAEPAETVRRVVQRRGTVRLGARWLTSPKKRGCHPAPGCAAIHSVHPCELDGARTRHPRVDQDRAVGE